MITTDISRALAILALDHDVVNPDRAVDLINASAGNDNQLLAALIQEADEQALLAAVAKELRIAFCDLYAPDLGLTVNEELLRRAGVDLLKRYSALPLVDSNGAVVVAIANPNDLDLRNHLASQFPQMTLALASKDQIQARLSMAASDSVLVLDDDDEETERQQRAARTATAAAPAPRSPLVGWVDSVLDAAVAQGVSDLHFEMTGDGEMFPRLRIDGHLRQIPAPPRGRELEVFGILMNRAGMDAANYLQPQDGNFSFESAGRPIDVRVAMAPTVNGPKVVMRLLDSANVRRRLSDMGFSEPHLETLRQAAGQTQGMVFVSGPTGSGKTTTLYALLREATAVERNVCTIEDPVEYRLPLVNQVQVRNVGERPLTFVSALRNMLRMDPDVILVGEVRDEETAKVSLDAASTGHLVLSTVHARDAIGVYTRLIEIGAPTYLVAEAVTVSVAQRLVRRLHDCAIEDTPNSDDIALYERFGFAVPEKILRPRGCENCNGTGYRGRVALVEVLTPSVQLRELVAAGATREELLVQARSDGFETLADHARGLIEGGVTAIGEVARMLEAVE